MSFKVAIYCHAMVAPKSECVVHVNQFHFNAHTCSAAVWLMFFCDVVLAEVLVIPPLDHQVQ